ncbi:MAG: hypothetical protein MJA84_17585 [Firmicutes bacterium]|nr:hypothetical protein [Bacillota bacterium]
MSRNLFPMVLTVFAAVLVYYLLSAMTPLSENLSMAAGVLVGIICAVGTKRLMRRE